MKNFNYQIPHNQFWQLIEIAQGDQNKFHELIYHFSLDELRNYQNEFFSVKLWTAAHLKIMEELTPKGSLVDTRLYVISQGYTYYQMLLQNPNKLLPGIESDHPCILYYTIAKVIKNKYKEHFFDHKNPQNRFWQLINSAKKNKDEFYQLLSHLSLDELRNYKKEFTGAKYNFRLKNYAEIIKENNLEDSFDEIRLYIISQGYEYYLDVLRHPEKLPLEIKADDPSILYNVIDKVMQDKYSDRLFDYTNPQNSFWKLIEEAKSDRERFYEIVSDMSFEELKAYEKEFDKAKDKLWLDADHDAIKGIASENAIEATLWYVVGKGYDYYMDISQNPQKLPQGIHDGSPQLLYWEIGKVMMNKYEDY